MQHSDLLGENVEPWKLWRIPAGHYFVQKMKQDLKLQDLDAIIRKKEDLQKVKDMLEN